MNTGTSALSTFFLALVVLIVVGPKKLPQGLEQLWLAIENFRRQQNNLPPKTLAEARRDWKRSGSPFYALIGGLYQGAEHLEELRRRLMAAAIVMIVTIIGSLFFVERIFNILKRPAGNIQLIFVRPPEMILTWFKVGLLCGFVLAIPVLVYELMAFIYPAMETPKEKRGFKIFAFFAIPSAFLFFVGGIAFAYFVLLPFALRYLFSFGSQLATPWWTISEYTNFVLTLLFWMGVTFETPLIMLVLAKMGIVDAKQLASKRKYAVVIIAIAAAVITPTPDPFNMALVMGPLLLLFELGILLARLVRNPIRRPAKEPASEPAGQ